MGSISNGVQALDRQHPEWKPWLSVIQELLVETANPTWDTLVPTRIEARQKTVPLLAGATLFLAPAPARRFLDRLLRIACHSGTPKMATLEAALRAELDVAAVFKVSLYQDGDRCREMAVALGADAEAFRAVTALVAMPFLQACNRRWASLISASWSEGYCPVCGAWPALAEVRGIERSRYFRCGRCGSAWQAHCLFCPYCGMTDHEELVSLVPEKNGVNSAIEACRRCLGYVKSLTTLQGSAPAKVMLDDLASVHLDVAAVQQGYKRPQGAGYSLEVTFTENGAPGSPPSVMP
jgi:FdhE protein